MGTLLIFNGLIGVLFLSAPSNSADSVAELSAEGYRDLIVNIADSMNGDAGFGQFTPGTGECIMTFTVTEATAKNVADRIKAWESARVPKALAASHAEILEWMKSCEALAMLAPPCFPPLLQQSAEQLSFLAAMGGYEDLRKNAATALAGMGVTLPSIEESTPEKKAPRSSAAKRKK